MTDGQTLTLSQLLALTWGELMMEKRYHSAASLAILGYSVARESDDDARSSDALALLLKSIEELKSGTAGPGQDEEKRHCSFCGRSEPQVKLAAGAEAFICNSCVETLHELFARGGK